MNAMRATKQHQQDADGYAGIPGTDITTTWEEVSPELAKAWLEFNTFNRNISRTHIDRLKKDIANDRYHVVHQGVAFDEAGVLLDGQHRLIAISELDVAVWMLVTRGLPAASQQAIDGGRKRGVGDWYEGRYRFERAAAARLSVAWQTTPGNPSIVTFRQTLKNLTTPETLELLTEDDANAIENLAQLAGKASRSLVCISHANLLGAIVSYGLVEEDAIEFLDGLHKIGGLEEGDPRIALVRMRGKFAKPYTQYEQFSFVMRALDNWMNDRPMQIMKTKAPELPILSHDPRAERPGE